MFVILSLRLRIPHITIVVIVTEIMLDHEARELLASSSSQVVWLSCTKRLA